METLPTVWTLSQHPEVYLTLLGIGLVVTMLPLLQYFLNSIFSPHLVKDGNGKWVPQQVKPLAEGLQQGDNAFKSSTKSFNDYGFGNDPLANDNKLHGLVCNKSQGYRLSDGSLEIKPKKPIHG